MTLVHFKIENLIAFFRKFQKRSFLSANTIVFHFGEREKKAPSSISVTAKALITFHLVFFKCSGDCFAMLQKISRNLRATLCAMWWMKLVESERSIPDRPYQAPGTAVWLRRKVPRAYAWRPSKKASPSYSLLFFLVFVSYISLQARAHSIILQQ